MSNVVEENLNLSEPLVLESAPTHHVYCENGVCKIDVSHNDDDRFNLFLSKSRSLFDVFLSTCVTSIKNNKNLNNYLNVFNDDPSHLNLYILCLKSYESSVKNFFTTETLNGTLKKLFGNQNSDNLHVESDEKSDNVDVENDSDENDSEENDSDENEEMFDNNFMHTIRLFAESQKNFSDILNKSKYVNNSDDESDEEVYEDDDDYDEDEEVDDTENEESDTDNSLLSVVRYFAQSQNNFSKTLYRFMNFE